jgi:hypothetical protein
MFAGEGSEEDLKENIGEHGLRIQGQAFLSSCAPTLPLFHMLTM